jgi:hypothetical protein
MPPYHIPVLVIEGVHFNSNTPLDLLTAIKLAKDFSSKGYKYHLNEEVGSGYERRTLKQLEDKLTTDNKT